MADGSGVRSRMYGIPEVWEPLTSVCFDEGWCGSLESKESNISCLSVVGCEGLQVFLGAPKGRF